MAYNKQVTKIVLADLTALTNEFGATSRVVQTAWDSHHDDMPNKYVKHSRADGYNLMRDRLNGDSVYGL